MTFFSRSISFNKVKAVCENGGFVDFQNNGYEDYGELWEYLPGECNLVGYISVRILKKIDSDDFFKKIGNRWIKQ